MYFFDLDETIVVKYEVEINNEKLKKLKKEIIKKCSMIEHKSYETINPLSQFNFYYMKNYKKEKTNKKDFETKKDIYLISYDLYNPPYLVTLIDELLLGNTSVINDIKNYHESFSINEPSINDKYKKLLDLLYDPDYVKIYGVPENQEEKRNRVKLLKEMEDLLTNYKNKKINNSKEKNIDDYRIEVLDCITMKQIETISLESLVKIQRFFDKSNEKSLNKTLKKY